MKKNAYKGVLVPKGLRIGNSKFFFEPGATKWLLGLIRLSPLKGLNYTAPIKYKTQQNAGLCIL